MVLLLLLFGPLGCLCPQNQALTKPSTSAATQSTWLRTELIFGLSLPGEKSGTVSQQQWTDFLKDVITPRFPEGLTVTDGFGQWRDKQGALTSEPSKIVLLVYPPTDSAESGIQEIRELYKKKFAQESVLRLTTQTQASF